jgi:serine/threonine-protein kinase
MLILMGNTVRDPVVVPGDVVDGRYRIISTLGEGGMGTVFLAEHTLIKRRVAVKILHPELATDANVIERFMNEARAAGTLGHPNIVESTDMGFTSKHVPYIVFEYLEGTLLTDEIYRVKGLPVRRAVRIAQQIASALHAAHNASIVHRDLKSDNIFLTDKDDALDHVKVLDFGISRFLEAEQTKRGMIMGTPEFMAPEQISAPDSVDRRADIWALGVILYEMLTARRPFSNDDDPRTLLHRIVHTDAPPLQRGEVPYALGELILTRMLAKDPAQRFQNMVDVEAALASFGSLGDAPRGPRARASMVDIARQSTTIPRPSHLAETPASGVPQPMYGADSMPMASLGVSLPPPPRNRNAMMMYGLVGVGLLVGAGGLAIGLRGGGHGAEPTKTAMTPAPAPAPLPAAAMPAPARTEPMKVGIEVVSSVPGARVTFRRHTSPAPSTTTVPATDIVELVEVSAPGYKTTRYWLTIDRPTRLEARLVRGDGMIEATEEQTLVALGEAPSPTIATAPTAATAAPTTAKPAVAAATPTVAKTVARPAAAPVEVVAAAVAVPTPAAPEVAKPTPRRIGKVDGELAIRTTRADDAQPATAPSPTLVAAVAPTAKAIDVPVTPAIAKAVEAPAIAKAVEVPVAPAIAKAVEAPVAPVAAPVAPVAKPVAAITTAVAPTPVATKPAIDTAAIQRAIGGHRGDVAKCFATGKQKNPDLKGTITLTLSVDASGKVHRVQVSSTLNSPLVAGCVVKAANGWQLPSHPGADAQVSYPFAVN